MRLAKAVATLDVLSGGRVIVTFGAGMAPGEFSALRRATSAARRLMDEYIQAMKLLWTADEPEFHGEFVDFADIVFEPKPLQRPILPSSSADARSSRCGARRGLPTAGRLGAQGGSRPWLSRPSDLPWFLAEARRCEGFAEREHAFEIAMHAVPVLSARTTVSPTPHSA